MSKLHLGGFVVIAAVAAGGADYVNQARLAGSAPASFGASAYAATISARVLGSQSAPAAPAVVARAAGTPDGGGPKRAGAASEGKSGGLFGGGAANDTRPVASAGGFEGNCALLNGVRRCSTGDD
ncbi:hypothetical protein [Albidovulum sp.]|uniref:hypothetical protein n=1 Tax=Albidovulum sp. TaxID=1872424 RepID=UPI0039B84FB0